MSNSPSQQELTDWELAKKIQEEWNKEPSQPTNQDPQKKVIHFFFFFRKSHIGFPYFEIATKTASKLTFNILLI